MKKLTKSQIQKKQENISRELAFIEDKLKAAEKRKAKLIEDFRNLSRKLEELENNSQEPVVQIKRNEPSEEAKQRVSEVLGF